MLLKVCGHGICTPSQAANTPGYDLILNELKKPGAGHEGNSHSARLQSNDAFGLLLAHTPLSGYQSPPSTGSALLAHLPTVFCSS